MNLIIFGASGGTGKLLTQQALQNGYNVTAFVRSPENFPLKHPNLKVKKGDILNVSFNNTDLLMNRITIVNSLGQILIDNQNISSRNLSVETNKLDKGVYFIYIESSSPSNRNAFTQSAIANCRITRS